MVVYLVFIHPGILNNDDSRYCCVKYSVVDPDPELLFSGSGIIVFRIRIQQNMKEQMNKNIISLWILYFVYCRTVLWNRKWQIVDRFFFMIEFKVVLFTIFKYS